MTTRDQQIAAAVIDLDALQALAEAATQGPWNAQERRKGYWSVLCTSKPPAISHELCQLSHLNINDEPIHWMPLPAAPDSEGAKG